MTASRQSQPIADVLADLTVIGPEEIARAGVQSLAELLQRQPGVEIVQNGGPGAVSGVFLRGANRGQTLVLSTACASVRRARGRPRWRRFRSTRSSGSRCCAGRRRASTAPTPSAASSRCSRAGAAARSPATRAPATARTTPGTSRAAWRGSAGPVSFALQAAAKESDGFDAIANPANFLYNPDRDGYSSQSVSANAGVTFAPEQEARVQYFRSRLDNQFDGGPGYDDRTITVAESWQAVSRNRLASFWVSQLSAAQGTDDSRTQTGYGDFPFETTQRQYTWQNELALPLGALTAGYERREERVATDAGFATTARDTDSVFGIYQLRVGAQAVQANLRHDDSSQYGGETTGAIAYSYRPAPALAPHRRLQHRLQGAVVQRSLLPRLLQSGPGAGDLAQRRGRRLLERHRAAAPSSRRGRSPTATRSAS